MRFLSGPSCLLLFLLFLAPQVNAQTSTTQALREAVDQAVAEGGMPNAWWTILIQDADTGFPLYERDTGRSFIPASNTKLYSTAAALDGLGTDFRFETRIATDGMMQDGTLKGNLFVIGSGDPVIGGRFTDGDITAYFRQWADSLKALGIHTVEGSVIGDDDAFDDVPYGYGWQWDDLPYWYAAEVGALSFNDNCIDFYLEATAAGQPAVLRWEPHNTSYVTAENRSLTVAADTGLKEDYFRAQGSNHFVLGSLVPEGRTDSESLTVANPTAFFVHVLREVLLQEGIAVRGGSVDIDDLAVKPSRSSQTHLFSHLSPTLGEIVRPLNKNSQNLYAEQVLRALAVVRAPEAGEPAAGSAALAIERARRQTFGPAGVDTLRLQLVDGSGLARQNLVTSSMTASLLRYMWQHPDAAVRDVFLASLPVAGVDGTLSSRLRGTAAEGKVRAKTGTVGNASALSGYVTTPSGKTLIVSIMANHFTESSRGPRQVQDRIMALAAQHSY
ncbi:MAG: D-alanyl-D-alanine carboxypeptidase/D-alanyl-D-alanine-endopeptidase [Bacteroidetes bacterium]|nr:D-alanyl-D-alanine carboxypeptidase/D-alanyl-D-alanine-endopeptidase [Bacteroidota bacterium]